MVNIFLVMPTPDGRNPPDEWGSEKLAAPITKGFRSQGEAVEYAKDQAKKKPGMQVMVIGGVVGLFEAKEPEIIEKIVSDTGEIIPKA